MRLLISKVGSASSVIEVIDALIEDVEADALKYMKETEAIMLSKVPYQTGLLKGNTGATMVKSNANISVLFKSEAPYAAYQEFGTIEWVDKGYISQNDVDAFASQFKSGTRKTTGGVPAKRYFFGPIRSQTFDFITRLRNLGFK